MGTSFLPVCTLRRGGRPACYVAAKELGRLWDAAKERLREAEVIVFVGFRFPPSDAEARQQLLKAIAENKSPHVEVHIVLGPERAHRDVVRLEQLLLYAMGRSGRDVIAQSRVGMTLTGLQRSAGITTHALFAEDFLTVWHRDLLWPAGLTVMKLPPSLAAR